MAWWDEIDASHKALVESGNIRYVVQPVGAAIAAISNGVAAAWAWAAYVQIVAAAIITNPSWLCGIAIHTPVVESHNGDIAIAIGALAAEVDLVMFHYSGTWPVVGVTAALIANAVAREVHSKTIWLPEPIRIVGAPRLAVRLRKDTAASIAGVSLKVILAEAIGT